jgi:hypothetical protein
MIVSAGPPVRARKSSAAQRAELDLTGWFKSGWLEHDAAFCVQQIRVDFTKANMNNHPAWTE